MVTTWGIHLADLMVQQLRRGKLQKEPCGWDRVVSALFRGEMEFRDEKGVLPLTGKIDLEPVQVLPNAVQGFFADSVTFRLNLS